jgi:hypothetical protein
VTLSSRLTIERAQQQLSAVIATDLKIPGEGWMANMDDRQYEGDFDGHALQLRGPFEYRKQSLLTKGELQGSWTGVTLKLVLRPDNIAYILVIIVVFCCIPVLFTRSLYALPISLLFVTFIYAMLRLHFYTEAGIIENLLERTLFAVVMQQ